MKASYWCQHFEKRLKRPWIFDPNLKQDFLFSRKKEWIRSLKAWQKGETSDGSRLKAAVQKSSFSKEDPDYFKVMEGFIREGQRHGKKLGEYLDCIGAPPLIARFRRYLFSSCSLSYDKFGSLDDHRCFSGKHG